MHLTVRRAAGAGAVSEDSLSSAAGACGVGVAGQFMSPFFPYAQFRGRSAWLWPALAAIAGWINIHHRFNQVVHADAEQTYLPAARLFLEQGWSFFLSPASYRVVPLAYLWPALWGAEPYWIRLANGGLWLGCVYFLWNTSLLLGGLRAGILAMFLWAIHPELPRYFATELTEPIFLFGVFGWIYFSAKIIIQKKINATTIWLAALMLTITLLSRPVLQIIAPILLITCLIQMGTSNMRQPQKIDKTSNACRAMAISLALSLIIPAIWIVKNGIIFGLWGLGTGSGTGLYLGTHPLFQGTEPPFLGLNYDVNILGITALNEGDHLSIAVDRIAKNAALWQIKSMSFFEGLLFFARKAWWWLMHHPSQVDAFGSALRKMRIFEILTVGTFLLTAIHKKIQEKKHSGSFFAKSPPWTATEIFSAALFCIFFLMLAQLLPILYNSRYSSALLDPWLILITSYGFSKILASLNFESTFKSYQWRIGFTTNSDAKIFKVLLKIALLIFSTPIIFNAIKNREQIKIDPDHLGKNISHLEISLNSQTKTYGLVYKEKNTWVVTESPAAFQVLINQESINKITESAVFNGLWKTELTLTPPQGGACRKAEISYQTDEGKILQPINRRPLLLALSGNGKTEQLVTHANNELRPHQPGSLRTVLNCPVGTVLQWKNTQFLESRHPWDATSHLVH
ncbi:hypothetical protein [Acidovorax sp. 1608163]|uniref:hypothetical protein n=1 Tax=Acidovorax sp. 1608163 TaxID=2478662 RepID=UPI0013CF2A7C|nr:hypothetical protein [Acidovorax sp. 1608163]